MVTCKDVPEGKNKLCNMVFQEKIPEETPVFARIAFKYRVMRLSEIMEKCGRCRSTVCITIKIIRVVKVPLEILLRSASIFNT